MSRFCVKVGTFTLTTVLVSFTLACNEPYNSMKQFTVIINLISYPAVAQLLCSHYDRTTFLAWDPTKQTNRGFHKIQAVHTYCKAAVL